jgi:basic membrane protein A
MLRSALIVLFGCLLLSVARAAIRQNEEPLKVAFLYQHNISDFGWTYSHDQGRLKMHERLDRDYQILSEYVEIAPTDARLDDCLAVVNSFVDRQFQMVIYCSSTFNKCAVEAAKKHTGIKHLSIGGNTTTDNLAWAFAKIYQARFLSGIIAGSLTQNNQIGYLAAVRNSQVRYNLNAFYLGVKYVNPSATVYLYWANTFLNTTVEEYGLNDLRTNYSIDVVSYQTSIYASKYARENGFMSIGYSSDARVFYGESVLTSTLFDWSEIYVHHVLGLINGTWNNQSLFYGWDRASVRLAPLSQLVRANRSALQTVDFYRDQFILGNDTVYCGDAMAEFNPQMAGNCLSDAQILSMNFVLPGIVDLGDIKVPPIVIEELFVDYTRGLGIALMVLAAICIAGTVVLIILTARFRNIKVFTSASPLFCFLIQGAAIVGYVAVFLWTGRPTTGTCIARAWLVNIGFILLYSCLFAKSWRVYVIFRNAKTLRVRVIQDKHLLVFGGLFLVPELVILTTWTAMEPMTVELFPSELTTDLQRNVFCYSPNALTFQLVLILYKAAVLIFGMFIAVATRNVRSDFNESKQIGFSIYNIFFVSAVILPLLYFLPMRFDAYYVLANVLILWIPSVTLLLLFVPKLRIAINNPNQSGGASSTSSTGRSHINIVMENIVNKTTSNASTGDSAKYPGESAEKQNNGSTKVPEEEQGKSEEEYSSSSTSESTKEN